MKFKLYTLEQEAKIEKLREQAAHKPIKGISEGVYNLVKPHIFNIGDRVKVSIESSTVIGYIVSILDCKFNVSTPYGLMKNVELGNLEYRHYEDLSHIVIPEELKKYSITNLISELRYKEFGFHYDDDGYYRGNSFSKFTEDQIRAELRTRPNIKSKRCSKTIKKYIKNNP